MWVFLAFALCLAPAYSKPVTTKSILFTYDNLPSNPVDPGLNPVSNPYMGLNFNNFDARGDGASQLRSISPNNTISSIFVMQLTSGTLANITSDYPGKNVTKFDFKSTYTGCAVLSVVSLGVEQACTVQFTGFTTAGKQITKDCTFVGTDGNPKPMVFCDFQGALNGVTTVDVSVANSQTLPPLTVLYLDNTLITEYGSS